jgi:hypothetical protein
MANIYVIGSIKNCFASVLTFQASETVAPGVISRRFAPTIVPEKSGRVLSK